MREREIQKPQEIPSTPSQPRTFDDICNKLGFTGLKVDDRSGLKPIKRMAIWHYMHGIGIKLTDIARQSNRTHPTVWSGVKKFGAYLDYGDKESMRLRDKISLVMATNDYVADKKYQKLFMLMKSKHNVVLTNDEMREIVDVVLKIE